VIPCPGSLSANYLIAARAVARIAKQANQNPAAEYRGMRLDTIENGKDGEQWNYLQRDSAYKSGVSSTQLQDSTITLDNTLLFYHPDNNVNPEFIKVIYLIKLQNIIYNINLIFNTDEWKQAALIPDHEVSSNIAARKPSDAVAALFTLTDNLANNALIADRKFTKDNITAKIDPSNPNRVNTSFPVKLTGNWDIHSIDLLFGFYLGAS
jgi:phage tail sheath gpL-like